MHPKAQQYRIRPCVVCGYKFSDEHHIHAELLGRSISPTIILCQTIIDMPISFK